MAPPKSLFVAQIVSLFGLGFIAFVVRGLEWCLCGGCRDDGPCLVSSSVQWRGGRAPWFGSGEASDGADLKLGLSSSTGGLQ